MPDTPPKIRTADEIVADAKKGRAGSGARTSRAKADPAPPRVPRTPPADDPPVIEEAPRKLTPTLKALREGLLDIYTTAEMACYMFDPFASQVIGQTKDRCADAWIELAIRDSRVKGFLQKLTTGSAWGGVITAHATLLLPILARRGIIPGGALFGGAMMNASADHREPTPEEVAQFEAAMAGGFTGTVPFNGAG